MDALALRPLARDERASAEMSKRARHILAAVIALSALASVFFGLRSYSSFLLLRSAYEVGKPQLSSLRAWMTLDHVAATYRVPGGSPQAAGARIPAKRVLKITPARGLRQLSTAARLPGRRAARVRGS